ncbi:hypothetical protein LTR36_008647 [Oleoguttula mirabilis]|uniref:DUF6594 domain-containing protein n=1 Tax=Oleoguttula mirabilis TaxID=1507867 RepID=A0AAV9JTP6_9PEZI|nr:hypothetical protein LTR36_008647 [Oleoguttula mirabilis]
MIDHRLPPFAPKTGILHKPPPINPFSPAPTYETKHSRKSTKSMDVVEAADSIVPWLHPSVSTRSLMSTVREKSKQESSTFAQRVFEAGKPDLLYDLRDTHRLKDHKYGVLDLTTLGRMNQHVLQQKLTEQVKAIGEKGAWMEVGIKQTLHDYCESIRDMEYMERCALRGSNNDPFLLSTADPLECKLLEDAGLAFGDPKKKSPQTTPDRLASTKRESLSKRGLRRLLMSLLGGLAVIAPFLIMILISGQLVRLIVTCAFTVAFAACTTVGSDLGPDRVALVTAAYAAALVVFVGTDPPSYQY